MKRDNKARLWRNDLWRMYVTLIWIYFLVCCFKCRNDTGTLLWKKTTDLRYTKFLYMDASIEYESSRQPNAIVAKSVALTKMTVNSNLIQKNSGFILSVTENEALGFWLRFASRLMKDETVTILKENHKFNQTEFTKRFRKRYISSHPHQHRSNYTTQKIIFLFICRIHPSVSRSWLSTYSF